ncbi:hypothetical protein [Bradyrhizobium lablabi]|uniref:hypothetical protein n=1 Tax=Bradyrhizobium lablabi TaxID=722472 RepID=UPI001BAE188F|nr:hypothetical protein [Bradyrhizobium lablabi]MBR0694814.1 hypothetical protein [Bradyrhizobium lablabi]
MVAINFRGGYEFDPETYAIGGGMLRRAIQQQNLQQQGYDFSSAPNGTPNTNNDSFGSPQSGMLRRLHTLEAEQGRYQPIPGTGERVIPLPQDPNFRQLSRLPNSAPPPSADSSASPATASQSIQQSEADQARQAREAAAARLARGVRSAARAEAPPPDSVDIAKSAGIGLAHGTINTLGLPGEALTGFGYLPNNLVLNGLRRAIGLAKLAPNEPDYIRQYATPDAIQQFIERYGPWEFDFYQPKTRAGRLTETIAEFVPALLGEAGIAARLGGPAAARVLTELPETIVKHAVAPGIVVQGVEEAYPESQAGEALQKVYPVARRVLPTVLAAKRYLGR